MIPSPVAAPSSYSISRYDQAINASASRLRSGLPFAVLAALAAAVVLAPEAKASNATWSLTLNGTWATDLNWSTALAPGATSGTASTDIATFDQSLTGNRTVTVDTNRNIGGITFGSNNSAFSYLLSGGNLLLSNAGVIQVTGTATSGTHTDFVSSATQIQGDGGAATFTSGGANTRSLNIGAVTGVSIASNTTSLTLNGTSTSTANAVSGIIGDGAGGGKVSVTKSGAGTWALSAANTYSGGTTVNGGRILVGVSSTFASGAVTSGAVGKGDVTFADGVTLAATGNFAVGATKFTLNGDIKIGASGSTSRLVMNGPFDLAGTAASNGSSGTVRTLTLFNPVLATAFTGGTSGTNQLGLEVQTNGPAITIANGTLRLAADAGVGATSFAVAQIGAVSFTGATGLTIGNKVITAFSAGTPFTANGTINPRMTVESGGVLNSGAGVVSRSLNLFSLSGAGVVTNLSNNATVAQNAVLTIDGSDTADFSGVIANGATYAGTFTGISGINGTISVVKSGTGNQTFSGANTFTGSTTLTGGILSVGTIGNGGVASGNLGSASAAAGNLIFNGGTLQYTGSNATSDRAFIINAAKTATIDTANNLTLVGANGTATNGALTKTGTGTLILTGANTNTGATTISAGTLQLGNGGVTGSLSPSSSIANNGALAFNRNNAVSQGTDFASVISGSGAVLQNGGAASTLLLSGNNSYTGLTTISGGTLKLGAAGGATNTPLGTNAAGTVVSGSGAALDLNGFTLGTAEALTLNGSGIGGGGALTNTGVTASTYSGLVALGSSSSIIASSGNITLSNTGTITGSGAGLTVGGPANVTIASAIGTGSGSVTKQDAGTLILSGNSTFTGGLSVQGGTLQIGVGSNFTNGTGAIGNPASSNLTLSNGVTVQSSTGFSVAAPTINLLGNVTVGSSTATGRLSFTGTWDLGGSSRTITLGKSSGATPFLAGSEAMQLEQLSGGNSTVIQNAGAGGSLTFASAASATAAQPSVVAINSSAASFASNTGLTLGDGVAMKSRTGTFFGTGSNSPALTLAGDAGKGGGVLQMGDGISSGNAVTRSAVVYSLAGAGTVTASNTTGNATTGTLTINNGNGANFSGTITDGGGTGIIALTKSGSATQILSGANSYSGNTTISGGTLLVTNTTGSGTGSGAVSVASGATLGGNGTVSGAASLASATIGSNGDTLKLGSSLATTGASTLATGSIVNVFSGTTITSGTFTVNGTLGGGINVGGAGNILNGSGTVNGTTTVSGGTINGSLSLGTLIATGNSTISSSISTTSGTTVQSGGILAVNGTLGGGAITVDSGATLKGNGVVSGATTINGDLAPGASPGGLTFSSSLTLAGTTTMEIDGTVRGVGGSYDAVDVAGLLTYGGTLTMSFGNTTTASTTYDLFGINGTQAGDFTAVTIGGTYASVGALTNSLGIWTGDDLTNNLHFVFTQSTGDLVVTAIPEPSAYAALAGLSVVGFAFYRRRSSRRAA